MCPGPSLPSCDMIAISKNHNKILSVNRACRIVSQADYWVATSKVALDFKPLRVSKNLTVVTNPQWEQAFKDAGFLRVWCEYPELDSWSPRHNRRCTTLAAAMSFAAAKNGLFCREIVIFGCDMAGDSYFDGDPIKNHETRWPYDTERLEVCMKGIEENGVSCRRMTN